VIRPFMQAFAAGADYYNPEFIAEQVRGARTAGGDGFLFWHPGSSYAMVQAGMAGPAKGMAPFPIGPRRAARRKLWGDTRQAAASELERDADGLGAAHEAEPEPEPDAEAEAEADPARGDAGAALSGGASPAAAVGGTDVAAVAQAVDPPEAPVRARHRTLRKPKTASEARLE